MGSVLRGTPHTATLVNPICAKRFIGTIAGNRHYSGQPALYRATGTTADNRHYSGHPAL